MATDIVQEIRFVYIRLREVDYRSYASKKICVQTGSFKMVPGLRIDADSYHFSSFKQPRAISIGAVTCFGSVWTWNLGANFVA